MFALSLALALAAAPEPSAAPQYVVSVELRESGVRVCAPRLVLRAGDRGIVQVGDVRFTLRATGDRQGRADVDFRLACETGEGAVVPVLELKTTTPLGQPIVARAHGHSVAVTVDVVEPEVANSPPPVRSAACPTHAGRGEVGAAVRRR